MRNKRSTVEYCTKQGPWDGQYGYICQGIDTEAILKKKNGRFSLIAKRIQRGETLQDIDRTDPGFVLQHMKKLKTYCGYQQILMMKSLSLPTLSQNSIVFSETPSPTELRILGWLLCNLLRPRQFKQRQLYLYGPHSTGKTSLILALEPYVRIYWMSDSSGWFDDFEEGCYDMIVIDEFKGMKIRFLNALLQGTPMTVPRRGNDLRYKGNLPVVILSNPDLEVIYPKVSHILRSALISRLMIVNVTSLLKLRIIPPSVSTTSSNPMSTPHLSPYPSPQRS
jgi:hypothetical protein